MASKLCPECGAYVHRSHARGFKEKLIRALSSYKAYRCHDCGWRGWFGKTRTNPHKYRTRLLTFVSLLVTFLITLLLAFYLIERMTAPARH